MQANSAPCTLSILHLRHQEESSSRKNWVDVTDTTNSNSTYTAHDGRISQCFVQTERIHSNYWTKFGPLLPKARNLVLK